MKFTVQKTDVDCDGIFPYEEEITIKFYGIAQGAACHIKEGGDRSGMDGFASGPYCALSDGWIKPGSVLLEQSDCSYELRALPTSLPINAKRSAGNLNHWRDMGRVLAAA